MKKFWLILVFLLGYVCLYAQDRSTFIDGVKATSQQIATLNPGEMASYTIKPDGAYIITKTAARNTYFNYFKSKSLQYKVAVPTIKDVYNVQYIINTTILTHDFDELLSRVNDKNLVSFNVIEKEALAKDYGITDKAYGIIITTKKMQ